MWIKNLQTGLIWEVTGKLGDRLSQDPNYKVIKEEKQKNNVKEEQQSNKAKQQKMENNRTDKEIPDYMQLKWPELRKYAGSLGVDVRGKTKQEIYQALELIKGKGD